MYRVVQPFGTQLGRLDIRQNKRFHNKTLAQLISATELDTEGFPDWSKEEQLDLLERELLSPRPFTYPDIQVDPKAETVLACYQVLFDHARQYGYDGFSSLIVSMTRNVSDLLVVYLFAREVGLMEPHSDSDACPIPVVPLFETIDNLERSHDILDRFLDHPVTHRSNAAYNIELFTEARLEHRKEGYRPRPLEKAIDLLVRSSSQAYRQLIETDRLFDFFWQATPIDIIESIRIGSRPMRRTGKQRLNDLCAIPQVFSWNQARFGISG